MTANHAHTPSSDHLGKLIWETIHNDVYETDLSFAGANNLVDKIMSSEWLAEVIADAEQRGAIKALRDAAESVELIDHMYANLLANQPIAVRETSKYLHNRADQMEGDDEQV